MVEKKDVSRSECFDKIIRKECVFTKEELDSLCPADLIGVIVNIASKHRERSGIKWFSSAECKTYSYAESKILSVMRTGWYDKEAEWFRTNKWKNHGQKK